MQADCAETANVTSLDALLGLAAPVFVVEAYRTFVGRTPMPDEATEMMASLVNGESRVWLLGRLRDGDEGRHCGAVMPGLRWRYLVLRVLRSRVVGPALEWLVAAGRLPATRRRLRAMEERDGVREAALEELDANLRGAVSRLDALFPPPLDDVLEQRGPPLYALARERFGLSPEASPSSLTPGERYAMFETVFYESSLVAPKQRVYLQYVNRELAKSLPFLDLGCGRGEFLRILREEEIAAVGVDVNPSTLPALRAAGFEVAEAELIAFLETDRRMFCGASLLQVVEHLTDDRLERALVLVAARLAPGAVLLVETPNPLSSFATSVFYTDATHLRPLPPERLRYQIEASGFEAARTLYQARIPSGQFAGPDPRAYYMDYAIIASRSTP